MSALQDKVVVITDGSSGLGLAAAQHLSARGAIVVLAARRIDHLASLVGELAQAGGRAKAVAADITQCEQVEALIAGTIGAYGRVDVMVNNAGLTAVAPASCAMVDEWDRVIDVTIKGLLYSIAAALPAFERQGSGHFINIASAPGAKMFSAGGAVRSGTKLAVRAISEGLRHEAGGAIRTTIISPGAVADAITGGSDHARARLVDDLYKLAIPADAVARAIAFAIEQPGDVDIDEIVLRPGAQSF